MVEFDIRNLNSNVGGNFGKRCQASEKMTTEELLSTISAINPDSFMIFYNRRNVYPGSATMNFSEINKNKKD